MPKPKMTKMTKEELAIWQKLEAMKRAASKEQDEAQNRSDDYWYQRGKVEAVLEILAFIKLGE